MWAIWLWMIGTGMLGAVVGVFLDLWLDIAEISTGIAAVFGASFGLGIGILWGYDRVGR